ncbi:MAG: Gfo/Idh/MocA family protein [Candidatus Merdivicinus sp.]|jgi:UDP-N-acetyl-2-amino-2-deoxyglucuronate dehydrogenase
MEKIRLGIIGVGTQGGSYARFLSGKVEVPNRPEHVELAALCDIDPAVKAKCAEEYPDLPFFDDYKALVDSGKVDAVITTVPHYFHPEMAIYAIGKGVHALVEKPAGVYTKQVREMNEFALAHPDVTFGIMFNQRTNPLYQKIKAIIDSGELGEIRRTNWIINSWWRPQSYYDQSAWRATWGAEGGGVLVNQAPHQLDLFQWMCGKPAKVWAKCRYGLHRNIVVENDVTAVLEYPNGANGVFVTCTHDVMGTDRLEIDLDGGKIVVEDSKNGTVFRLAKTEQEISATMTSKEVRQLVSGGSVNQLYTEEKIDNPGGWGSQHMIVMENFARHILFGDPLLAPGTDGINGVALANAILLSDWLGKEIEMPLDEDVYLEELNKHIAAEGKYPTR